MAWTSPAELREQVHKQWNKGTLLAYAVIPNAALFPLRLTLIAPSSSDLSTRFAEARAWAADLRHNAIDYRIEERDLRHREVGVQTVPACVWLDSVEAAIAFIGKAKEAKRFAALVATTRDSQTALLAWLVKRPLAALALAAEWPRLLAVVAWLQAHPRPNLYLRQVDIAGVDSKFIEAYRSVLSELLDIALPAEAVDPSATGAMLFARRYGFKDKPLRIRFRWLDAPGEYGSDISLTQAAFEQLAPKVSHVFITENEVNFLAFPQVPNSIVVFGAGYGFEALAGASWLHRSAEPTRFEDLSLSVVKLLGSGAYAAAAAGAPAAGHFGLAVNDYAHSTAPNRRHVDLVTQRLLKATLARQDAPYSMPELEAIAAHCTLQEDSASTVERRVLKAAAAFLLHDRIGETFDAVVTGAAAKGTFVRIASPLVEGRVVGGFEGLDVGDALRVRLRSVDAEQRFIDFERA